MKCPFPDCGKNNMPMPPKVPRPFGQCPDCGRKSRASISYSTGGKIYIHYSATNLRGKPEMERKRYRSYGVSPEREAEIKRRGYKSVQDYLDNG